MSDIGKTALKNKIDAKIYDNESQLITGAILNEVLQDAVDTLADGGNLDAGSVDTANLNDEAVTKGKLEQNVSADLDWAVASNSYYRNSQAGDVAAKVITTYKNMNLIGGGSLKVTFEQANTADDATLNIDGKGAKPLYYNGARVSSTNSWEANETVEIYYNNYNSGAYYAKRWMVEPVSVSQNTETGHTDIKIGNNTYPVASTSEVQELREKISDLSLGKFYGFFEDESDLPTGDLDGYAYVGASMPFAIYVFKDGEWSDSGTTYAPPVGNGEDIDTNSNNQLQFADRQYNSETPDGLGYVILRKDRTFTEQIANKPNTIFEIRYDFDLDNANVAIPDNCVLKFVGGLIKNGTLTGYNTKIDADIVKIFDSTLNFAGTWNITQSYPEWFGAKGDGVTNDYVSVQNSLNFGSSYFSSVYNLNGNKLIPKSDGKTIFTFAEKGALKNGEIDADISFSIMSGNNYIFQDIDFVGNPAGEPGTTLQFVRHDVNAEWFGIYREGIEHNAERLERLLNCYKVSVRFDSDAYYFNRPIEAKTFGIEMHGTSQRGTSRSKLILVQDTYYNEYAETNVFLKLNTYETVIEGISFQAILVNISNVEYTYFNGIELVDNINKGQVDTYITNCGFEGFDRAIIAHGRGIDVENCWFTRCNFGLRYIPAVEQAHQDPNQNPPYDGRAIRFINNRLHWMYVFVGYGQLRGAVAVYLDTLPNETRYVHGIQIINNLCDVYCGLLYSLVGIIKGNIIGNSCNNWRQYQMYFKEDVIDTVIANNNLSFRIPTDISADYNAEDSRCNNCIYFEGSIDGLIITGNTGKIFKQNFVRFNNNTAIINNVVISGNIISNEDDYRGVLGLDSARVSHLKCINNTINIATGKIIWDAFLPYSANTIFEDVEVDAFTATRFQGKYKVNLIGYPNVGDSSQRPTIPSFIHDNYKQNSLKGLSYFDITLNKTIFAKNFVNNQIVWVDADGNVPTKGGIPFYGSTSQRPNLADVPNGFKYYDSGLDLLLVKTQWYESGVLTDHWVDSNGQTPGKHAGDVDEMPKFLQGTGHVEPTANDYGYRFFVIDDDTIPLGTIMLYWNGNAGNGGAWVDGDGNIKITNP